MSFHIFHIQEVYSSANGDVQYVEFVGEANGQNLWGSKELDTNSGADAFPFGHHLPSSATSGKSVLVATQGYAALGLATPDFIIPNDFLLIHNGMVTFPGMTGGLYPGSMSWADLPTDGIHAHDHFGEDVLNTPFNFAGVSGAIPGNPILGTAAANTLTGTAGKDFIVGLNGNDVINGGGGNDTLKGGLNNDNLNGGAGADRIQGDAGNDTMVWAATDLFNGGAGIDKLRLTAGNLDLTVVANSKVVGTETVDMTGGGNSTLTLNKSEVLAISNTTDTLTVLGTAGDTVNLIGAFVMTGSAGGFDTWKLGTAIVKIDTDVTVI